MPEGVDHVMYIIPGKVDGAVCKEQSEQRYMRNKETSIVHDHRKGEPCKVSCKKYDGSGWKAIKL